MKKRVLASLLSLCLIVGLLPTAALAAEDDPGGGTEVSCTESEGCLAEVHKEDCPLYAPPEEEAGEPETMEPEIEEPVLCTATEGCTLEAGHEGDCVVPSEELELTTPLDDTASEDDGLVASDEPASVEPTDVENSIVQPMADDDASITISEATTITEDTTWENAVTLSADLTVNSGVTLTIGAEMTISGSVTISGGGTIKRDGDYSAALIEVPSEASLTLENITVDGGAVWDTAESSSDLETALQRGTINSGIASSGALISLSGTLSVGNEAMLQNNARSIVSEDQENTVGYGAGVDAKNGSVLIMTQGSSIKNNHSATAGGGISSTGEVTIEGAVIIGNDAGNHGGGLYISGSKLSISDSEISHNAISTASTGYGPAGGGLKITVETCDTDISDTKIESNYCSTGNLAAAMAIYGAANLENCTITQNKGAGIITVSCLCENTNNEEDKVCKVVFTNCKATQNTCTDRGIFTVEHYGSSNITLQGGEYSNNTSTYCTFYHASSAGKYFSTEMYVKDAVIQNNTTTNNGYGVIFDTIPIHVEGNTIFTGNTTPQNSSKPFTIQINGELGDEASIELGQNVKITGSDTYTISAKDLTHIKSGEDGKIPAFSQNEEESGTIELVEGSITPISLEYGDEYTSTSGTPTSVLDEDVLTIRDGKVEAIGVGETNLIVTQDGGAQISIPVTVTPMPIIFGEGQGENPGGSISYVFDDMAPSYTEFATFYPAEIKDGEASKKEDSEAVTLTEGDDIVYVYQGAADTGPIAHDTLPLNVTDSEGVTVQVKMVNPNYRFVTNTNPTPSETVQVTVTVLASNMTVSTLYIDGEEVDAITGATRLPYTGEGRAPKSDLTSTKTENDEITQFTVHFHPLGDMEFEAAHLENKSASELTSAAVLEIAPKEPGTYTMVVDGKTETHYASASIVFSIIRATPTGEPSYTPISTSGKALADAALRIGTISPAEGTIKWDMEDATEVTQGTAYQWTFTPTDTDHYETLTGSIVLWPNSGSSGNHGSSGSTTYAVSVDRAEHGSVSVSPTRASRGSTVTITATPDDGYELDSLTVTDANGSRITLTDRGSGKYTFTMPASRVEVNATFAEVGAPEPEPLPFVDVPSSAYYYDAVAWAVENGITNGTSATTFGPDVSCTRAQMVTFLWRAAGSPEPVTTSNPFTDIQPGAYYYDAVLWAVEQGITSGTSATTFSPDATCTRAQMVTFLWRQEGSPVVNYAMSFTDVDANAYYAEAVRWAVSEGVTNGTSATTFSPDMDCTRAQIVTLLYRAAQ